MKQIIQIISLLLLSVYVVIDAQAVSGESPNPQSQIEALPPVEITATPQVVLEVRKCAVVKVEGTRVYVDAGEAEGVLIGMEMELFQTEPIKDLKNNVIDKEEIFAGKMTIVEVRPALSIGELNAPSDVQRGFFARYSVLVKTKQETVEKQAECPKGMFYDGGGQFKYRPGAASINSKQPPEATAETKHFCVDGNIGDKPIAWREAGKVCESQGKRLCSMDELKKICAIWEKPKPCPEEMLRRKECEQPDTVIGPGRNQEWTADAEKPSSAVADGLWSNSCSCSARMPVCSRCVYEGCRGAKKYFRCCADPILKD